MEMMTIRLQCEVAPQRCAHGGMTKYSITPCWRRIGAKVLPSSRHLPENIRKRYCFYVNSSAFKRRPASLMRPVARLFLAAPSFEIFVGYSCVLCICSFSLKLPPSSL